NTNTSIVSPGAAPAPCRLMKPSSNPPATGRARLTVNGCAHRAATMGASPCAVRSEPLQVMQEVGNAKRSSPLEVTQAGVKAFDFIASGGSILATLDAFDRLHRETYMQKDPPNG
ncbi:hypothetical protein, partial [Stenotrophomonas maltophilia]|uniref:hypothetical protein n=1 Tax=Stenotrophomonas maltophilia TaxID=40324 RepID=UPI001E311D13